MPIRPPLDTLAPAPRHLVFWPELRGLHFLGGLVLSLILLALVVHTAGVLEIDLWASQLLQRSHTPYLDQVMQTLSLLGTIGALVPVALLCALLLLGLRAGWSAALPLASLLAYPLNVWIKGLVERVRPSSALVKVLSPVGGYSFPSGHAMVSAAVYGTCAYLLWVHLRSGRRFLLPLLGFLLPLLIGLSRVYLGVHWPSDVLGGWIGGAIVVLALAELQARLSPP